MMNRKARRAARVRGPEIAAGETVSQQAFKEGVRPQVRKVGVEKFGVAAKRVFLDMLRQTANVTRSAKAAGVSLSTVRRHRDRYPQFELEWLDAQEAAIDLLEATMVERALRYNQSLAGAGLEGEEQDARIEPFSNGDAMRLIKLHRESITARRVEIAAKIRQSPAASYKELSEKLEGIYQRILARDKAANDLPV
jgi:ATPase subunit of ABC transporter with duplicated ATPase domains